VETGLKNANRLICRHYDVPYRERRCPRCHVIFYACPVCGGTLCPECDQRSGSTRTLSRTISR